MYLSNVKGFRAAGRMLAGTALAAAILLSGSVPMAAGGVDQLTGLKNQYAALQQQQQELQSQINSQNSQLQSVNDQISRLNASIGLTNQQISVLNAQIAQTDAQLSAKASDIAATQKRVDDNFALYKKRMRAMYETGDVSYIEVLLESSNINDFLSRTEMLKSISVHDNDLINSLKSDVQRLKDDQAALEADRDDLQQAEGAMAAKQLMLQNQQVQQAQLSEQLKTGLTSTQQQAASVKQQAQQTDAQIDAIIAAQAAARKKQLATQQATSSQKGSTAKLPASGSVGGSYIVQFAKQFVGCPYAHAGSGLSAVGPNSFDCSGFVQYVYANAAGISLPRSSVEQANYGTYVDRANLQPGDLVYFHTDNHNGPNGVSHIGIYVGNNQFIAANSSTGVVVSKLFGTVWDSQYKYLGARRILG